MATNRKKSRQLTLHFTQDTEHILDGVEEAAAKTFRTPEQTVLFALSAVFRKTPARTTPGALSAPDDKSIVPPPAKPVETPSRGAGEASPEKEEFVVDGEEA